MPEPSTPPTIRQHLQAQNEHLTKAALGIDVKANCDAAHDHAVAALDLLNNATTYPLPYNQAGETKAHWQPTHRLVPDPEAASHA